MPRKKGRANTSIKDLVQAMQEVIEQGERDTDANIEAVAEKLDLTPLTVRQKIRAAKFDYPQVRLMDLTFFVAKPGQRKETYEEDELNEFFAELLGKPIDDIEAELEEAKVELEEDEKKRAGRKRTVKTTN
jgi:hypothetical protein